MAYREYNIGQCGPTPRDITNQPFGKLIALECVSPPGEPRKWRCRCVCGKETIVLQGNLTRKRGGTTSCGCHRLEILAKANEEREVDLVGQKRGRLTVEKKLPADGKNARFLCLCDCGERAEVRAADLESGQMQYCTRTCPLRPRRVRTDVEDLTDWVSGWLTVLDRVPAEECADGKSWWNCICKCGNPQIATGTNLRAWRVISCGCALGSGEAVRPEHIRKKQAEYFAAYRKINVAFNINGRVRALLLHHINSNGLTKSKKTYDILGYTIADLVTHLQTTLPKGVSWEDFLDGDYHIDHIRPLSSFKITSEDDPALREAWALSNLQILPGPDNLSKGASMDWYLELAAIDEASELDAQEGALPDA